jgi:hypothetical protein
MVNMTELFPITNNQQTTNRIAQKLHEQIWRYQTTSFFLRITALTVFICLMVVSSVWLFSSLQSNYTLDFIYLFFTDFVGLSSVLAVLESLPSLEICAVLTSLALILWQAPLLKLPPKYPTHQPTHVKA